MIKEQEILDAIAECQGERNPNANTCRNLAAFYTILDHIREVDKEETPAYSYSAGLSNVNYQSDSEFSQVVRTMDVNDVLAVMDELMETLSVINPRLYSGVMRKLN